MIDACLPPKETILGMSSEVISDRCRSCVKDVVQKVGDSWTEGGRRVGAPGKGWELFAMIVGETVLGCPRNLGSMVIKWGRTYLQMGYIGVITHLLTIDPNFLAHPSRGFVFDLLFCMDSHQLYPCDLFSSGEFVVVWSLGSKCTSEISYRYPY